LRKSDKYCQLIKSKHKGTCMNGNTLTPHSWSRYKEGTLSHKRPHLVCVCSRHGTPLVNLEMQLEQCKITVLSTKGTQSWISGTRNSDHYLQDVTLYSLAAVHRTYCLHLKD
jgi:hypothetical protein